MLADGLAVAAGHVDAGTDRRRAHVDLEQQFGIRRLPVPVLAHRRGEAVELLAENDSILMGAGSTVQVMAETLKPKGRLNVVTPAVNVAIALGDMSGVSVMQLGGILYGNSMCVIGTEAKSMLQNLQCTKLFFGVDGVDPAGGASCATVEEAELLSLMARVADTVIVLADSSKIGAHGFGRICSTREIDILITDSGIKDESRKAFEKSGVKVIVA